MEQTFVLRPKMKYHYFYAANKGFQKWRQNKNY